MKTQSATYRITFEDKHEIATTKERKVSALQKLLESYDSTLSPTDKPDTFVISCSRTEVMGALPMQIRNQGFKILQRAQKDVYVGRVNSGPGRDDSTSYTLEGENRGTYWPENFLKDFNGQRVRVTIEVI